VPTGLKLRLNLRRTTTESKESTSLKKSHRIIDLYIYYNNTPTPSIPTISRYVKNVLNYRFKKLESFVKGMSDENIIRKQLLVVQ